MSRFLIILTLGLILFLTGCSTFSSVTKEMPWVKSQEEKEFREKVANDPFPRAGTNKSLTIQKFNP